MGINKKSFIFVGILLCAGGAFAQAPVDLPPQTLTRTDNSTNPISILPSVEGGKSFFSARGFVDGSYDINAPVLQNGVIQSGNSASGFGVDAGGGVSAFRTFATGELSLTYSGDFHDYTTPNYPTGFDQDLNVYVRKVLARRWSLYFGQNAGIFYNGGNAFPFSNSLVASNVGQNVILNPFSQNTKFLSSSLSLSYQQSLRWSYTFGGDFYLSRYSGNGTFGSTGGDGMGSISYRLTRATSLSGSYSHSYFSYENGAGSSSIDSVYATLSHDFHSAHWQVGASGGFSRVNSQGSFFIPGFLPSNVNQQLTAVITQGTYKTTSTVPSFAGSATRTWKHTSLSFSGGQTVNPGNGLYLASRALFIGGYYNIAYRRSNLSFGGDYSRLSSLANTISSSYGSSGANVNYSYRLARYIGANANYSLTYYGNIGAIGGRVDNRLSFGVNISTANVPFSYF